MRLSINGRLRNCLQALTGGIILFDISRQSCGGTEIFIIWDNISVRRRLDEINSSSSINSTISWQIFFEYHLKINPISFEYKINIERIHSHFRIFHYVFRRSIVQNPRIIHYCHWLSLWTKIIIQSELIFRLFSAYLSRRLRDFNIRNKNWYAVNSSQFSHGINFL